MSRTKCSNAGACLWFMSKGVQRSWKAEGRRRLLVQQVNRRWGSTAEVAFVLDRWLQGQVILLRPFTPAEGWLLWHVLERERKHAIWAIAEMAPRGAELSMWRSDLRWLTKCRAEVRRCTPASLAELRDSHQPQCAPRTSEARSL